MTYREMCLYAKTSLEERWWHTASLSAGVANLFAKKPIDPRVFHPFHSSEVEVQTSRFKWVSKGSGAVRQFKERLAGVKRFEGQ